MVQKALNVTSARLSWSINYGHELFKVTEKELIEENCVLLLETLQKGAFPQGSAPG
jgi:hypothetical protein